MIQQIRIQNFRSLKDVTLDLQQVNLLIGPNNSGKTNALKALNFFGKFFAENSLEISNDDFKSTYFKKEWNEETDWTHTPIVLSVVFSFNGQLFLGRVSLISPDNCSGLFGKLRTEEIDLHDERFYTDHSESGVEVYFEEFVTLIETVVTERTYFNNNAEVVDIKNTGVYKSINYLSTLLSDTSIYKPDPAKFSNSASVSSVLVLNADGSNVIPFLFSLSQNYKKKFAQLESDLKNCVGDIVSIATPPDPTEIGKLKLKFFDVYDNDYWADEVSEGVLYFLAILCIVHQPNPPKLLLLEEPEKGIHPRRIREVVDFVFDLAYDKGIQVIMTTHDTYVVDQFADIPEAVFVFDKKDGATEVKNLQKHIIEPADQLHAENGLPPTNYTRSLGEHWAAGFLGGVPR